ncbi:hypothetical protein [Aequorivita antarctica]|nr:hypothetical protein [Aequorivita antarctica]SRX76409.1 hypothetical protein AEQU3_03409 [Aequorivita antarctica]
MNETLKILTKLRIAGMLSEAAKLEAEKNIQEKPRPEASENNASITFG